MLVTAEIMRLKASSVEYRDVKFGLAQEDMSMEGCT